ncbi:hypothetical protein niasHS_000109 [Heterodera schachtii]|uniref:Uncharacterized protein n=1 Tax=Heterodera schachtii TaxID=97005 RepID=A0ABD2K6Q3_HETSC
MKLVSDDLIVIYHLFLLVPPIVFGECPSGETDCSEGPAFKCRFGYGNIGHADDKIDQCEACFCKDDPYCITSICDTKKAEKNEKVFYAFWCANKTDFNGSGYCNEKMKKFYPNKVEKNFNCFCHLGPEWESMYNRNLFPKEKAPDDLQHLFSSPTKDNSSSTKTGPLLNLLLISNILFLTAAGFDLFMAEAC